MFFSFPSSAKGQRKQRHSLKLGKKRQENSLCNYYIISPRVMIKAIIIVRVIESCMRDSFSLPIEKECAQCVWHIFLRFFASVSGVASGYYSREWRRRKRAPSGARRAPAGTREQ